jgi:hypothetical protein
MASDLLRPLGLYAGQELLLLQLRERAGMVTRHASADDRRVMLVSSFGACWRWWRGQQQAPRSPAGSARV